MHSNVFNRFRLVFIIIALPFGVNISCSGKNTNPIQCEEGLLLSTFPGFQISNLPNQSTYTLFQKESKLEYGCLGLVWKGQSSSPPSYPVEISETGYKIQNPQTKKFEEAALKTSVDAGVETMDILVFLFRNTEPENLNCGQTVQSGLTGCWNNDNCLFAWKIKDVPTNSNASGTCSICQRESCNGLNDNCDPENKIDEESCGSVLGESCQYIESLDQATPCTANGSCSCLLIGASREVHLCTGDTSENLSWTPLSQHQSACTTNSNRLELFCGTTKLLCDECDSKPVFRKVVGTPRCGSNNLLQLLQP